MDSEHRFEHSSRYVVPEFQLWEYVQAAYGYDMKPGAGNSYYCQCPIHNDHTPPSEKTFRIWAWPGREGTPRHGGWLCPRNRAQQKGNAWDFLTEVEGLPDRRDPGFDQTLEHVAETLDLELTLREDYEVTSADKGHQLLRDMKEMLSEIEFPRENHHYWKENRQWVYRGLPTLQWLRAGVGMLSKADVRNLENTYSEEAFTAAGVFEMGSFGRKYLTQGVVFMRPSRTGSPVGWGVRRYEELGARDNKYIKNENSELLNHTDYLFGLDKIYRSDSPIVLVVEGEIDCMALRLRDTPPVIAIGGAVPTGSKARQIREMDAHPVFVLDADSAAQGFDHAAATAEDIPNATFIPLSGDNDPDSFVQKYSARKLLEDMSRYSAREARMFNEEAYDFSEGRWTRNHLALARKYMEEIVEEPFVTNEDEVVTAAHLADLDPDYLRSWLFQERNKQAAAKRPDPVDWSSGGPTAPA